MHIDDASELSIFFSRYCISARVNSSSGSTKSGNTFHGCDASKSKNLMNATSLEPGGSTAPGCKNK